MARSYKVLIVASQLVVRSIFAFAEIIRQQCLFLGRHGPALQEIRPALVGTPQGLLQAPAANLLVVAAEQHIRHPLSAVVLRPGVVRAIQQAVADAMQDSLVELESGEATQRVELQRLIEQEEVRIELGRQVVAAALVEGA